MIEVIRYQSHDGQIFDTAEEALIRDAIFRITVELDEAEEVDGIYLRHCDKEALAAWMLGKAGVIQSMSKQVEEANKALKDKNKRHE